MRWLTELRDHLLIRLVIWSLPRKKNWQLTDVDLTVTRLPRSWKIVGSFSTRDGEHAISIESESAPAVASSLIRAIDVLVENKA